VYADIFNSEFSARVPRHERILALTRLAFLYSYVYSLHLRRRSDPEGLLISDTGNDLRRCNYRHSSAFVAFYGDRAGTAEFPVFLPPHPEEAAARVRCSSKRPEIGRGGNLIPERTWRTHSAAARETGAWSQLLRTRRRLLPTRSRAPPGADPREILRGEARARSVQVRTR